MPVNNDEFLTGISSEFHRDILLKLLGVRVLNEPTLVLDLAVTDQRAILVVEGKLVTIVLSEDSVAIESGLTRDVQVDALLFTRQIRQEKRRAEDLTANELTVVDHIRVDIKN